MPFRDCTLFNRGMRLEIFTKSYQKKPLSHQKSMTKKSLPCIQLLQRSFYPYAKDYISKKKLTAKDMPHLVNNLTKTWVSSYCGCL